MSECVHLIIEVAIFALHNVECTKLAISKLYRRESRALFGELLSQHDETQLQHQPSILRIVMDTTHINSIYKKISMLPDHPCCISEELDFERLPSSLNYFTLVDALPCFNPSNDSSYEPLDSREGNYEAKMNYEAFRDSKPFRPLQVKALESFKLIHSTVARALSHHGVSIDTIKQYAACFVSTPQRFPFPSSYP